MNVYKNFRKYKRDSAVFNTLSKRFDQPTYISFRLSFGVNDSIYNSTGNDGGYVVNYDKMPHPLFGSKQSGDYSNNQDYYTQFSDRALYSTIDFLIDANEFTRAKMMEEFIQKFNTLQRDYQWYFQKIDGVAELLKIDPKNGMRVTPDKRLTITMLEGIDLRISHLLNLYRKIAWDDVYQRWVLPEMMRYFTLDIYLAEFRTFHTPGQYDGWGEATNENREEGLYLNLLDDILPVWLIRCEMCEFDVESIEFDYLSNLGVGEDPTEAGVKFSVKVGKVFEEQVYPTFRNMYLVDRQLNGFDRSREKDLNSENEEEMFDSTSEKVVNNGRYSGKLFIAQSHPYGNNEDRRHRSGASYNEMTNSKDMFGANAAGEDGTLFSEDDNVTKVDPTKPNTWINNAVTFGKAFGNDLLNTAIDKAKTTPIPNLGVSFNEVEAALQSKNFITALGLIRKSISQMTEQYVQPSGLLDDVIDNNFRQYLTEISKSAATTETNVELKAAANMVLNDDNTWGKIKDFSRATDMVGEDNGEVNSPNPIESPDIYKNISDKATGNDLSHATDMIGVKESNIEPKKIIATSVIESAPSSTATNGKII